MIEHSLARLESPVLQLVIAAGCLITAGCGDNNPKTYIVTGSVVFEDGKPLDHGSVEFQTKYGKKPITAVGEIGPDGKFQLSTYKPDDGALPGEHRVAVFSARVIGSGAERPDQLPPPELDPKFSNTATSELKFTVKEDEPNEFRIEVTRMDQ